MKDKRLEEMKMEYENIEIPAELKSRVSMGIQQAKEENQQERGRQHSCPIWIRPCAGVVAAMIAFVIVVNSNANIAYAMEEIPVLGTIVKVVTFSSYQSKDEDMSADIQTPQIEVEEDSNMKDAAQQVNKTVKEYTDEVIRQYEKDVEATNGQGTENVTTDYEVVTDNDTLFSLRVNTTVALNTSGVTIKIYHIDKKTGKMIALPDLFQENVDYKKILTDEVLKQIKEQMAKDENVTYFVDDDATKWKWQGITDDANFYFNKDGCLTMVFDKYEIAPGYMGVCEFTIPKDITDGILADSYK